MAILETKNLRKIYGSGENEVHALDGVSISVNEGEFVAVIGTSGSGKSTLLNMIGGLDRPTSGDVTIRGKQLLKMKDEELTIFRRRNIGFVFQNYNLLEGFGVGCDDYIPKPFSIEVLRKKVQAVLKRTGGGKSRIRYRDLEVDTDKCLVMLNGEEVRLTSTEYKLLCYLIENKGRIVTKAMLLEQLWDIDGNFVDENIQIAQDTTKTKSSMRTLPLVPAFKEKLLKLKEQQEEYKRVCGRCYNKKYLEYICVDEMGTLISPHYLTSSFPKLLEKNNLRHIRFHDLRHSCASLLLANGVPMKQIQEWLGHSDFSTTANVYAHLDYNSKLSSADAMVNGLSGALEAIS